MEVLSTHAHTNTHTHTHTHTHTNTHTHTQAWLGSEPVNEDTSLEDLAWFNEHFPEEPLLAHAVATFRALAGDA
jgi:hypothetical protein